VGPVYGGRNLGREPRPLRNRITGEPESLKKCFADRKVCPDERRYKKCDARQTYHTGRKENEHPLKNLEETARDHSKPCPVDQRQDGRKGQASQKKNQIKKKKTGGVKRERAKRGRKSGLVATS